MVFNIIVYFIIFIVWLLNYNYENEVIRKILLKDHPLKVLYHISARIYVFFQGTKIHKKGVEKFKLLYSEKSAESLYKLYVYKQLATIILILILFNTFSVSKNVINFITKEKEISSILRPVDGEEYSIDISTVLNNGKEDIQEKITLIVEPKQYTEEEFHRHLGVAKKYIDKVVLGKNNSIMQICDNLQFVKDIPYTNIKVKWDTSQTKLINGNGEIMLDQLHNKEEAFYVIAILYCGNFQYEYMIKGMVIQKPVSKRERLLQRLQELIRKQMDESKEAQIIQLPNKIDNYLVKYKIYSENQNKNLICLCIVMCLISLLLQKNTIVKKIKRRNQQLIIDYPEIINKLVLYLGAGMTISLAISRLASDYSRKKQLNCVKTRIIYEELILTDNEIKNGIGEVQAYINLGKRIRITSYLKLTSLFVQCCNRGVVEILHNLEYESYNAFEERKELAKRLGEEASTKLLFPMLIMMCLVLIIILIPAFYQLS